MDFAENYNIKIQFAVQGNHWDNQQVTLHPFSMYNLLNTKSYYAISNNLNHSSSTVHTYISRLIEYTKD